MNHTCLVGQLTRAPTTTVEADGRPLARFTLAIPEPSREGKAFTLYVPCVSFGKTADACSGLEASDLVAIQGKLSWQKRTGKCGHAQSTLVVQVREVQVLQGAEVPA